MSLNVSVVGEARIRKALPLLPIGLVLMGSACGAHPRLAVRHGTIEIRRDVPTSSLVKGVLGIRTGSSASRVSSVLGEPFTKVSVSFRGAPETCWGYRASQPGTSVDGLSFCINRARRVERIMIGVHG